MSTAERYKEQDLKMKSNRVIQYLRLTLVLLSIGVMANVARAEWETVIPSDSMTPANFDTHWEWFYPWGQTHNGSAKMYQEQVTLTSSGETTIVAVTPDPFDDTHKYASGAFNSQAWIVVSECDPEWVIEGEFKAPTVTGSWPAFWITGAWSWPPEVDILEFKGNDTNWFNTFDGGWETEKVRVTDAPDAWHRYTCVLTMANSTDIHVDFYLDGVWQAQHTGSNMVGQPFDVIVNLQMEGSSGSPGPTSPTSYLARNIVVQANTGTAPPGAPSVPANLKAFPRDSGLHLKWSNSPECDLSHYNVYFATTAGGPYDLIAEGVTSPAYVDDLLTNGTTYYYVVTAVDLDGNESVASSEASGVPEPAVSTGKPVTASTFESGRDPSNANDDDYTSRWTASSGSYPQWWKVDLGSVQSINKASIHWFGGDSRSYKYTIETSTDDVTYTTVVDESQRTATGDSIDFFSVDARYVRVTVTGSSGGWAAFYECRIGAGTDVPPGPELLSEGRPATASSSESGNGPSNGNDGDLSTRWTASSGEYPQWWRVDLGSVQEITRAEIDWYGDNDRSYQYRIETSDDDVNYTTVVDQTGRTATGSSSDTFSASARYVRVTATGVSPSGGWAAFWECRIFGDGGGTTPPSAPTSLTATAVSSSQIDLSWTASSGADSYNVKRATVSGGPYTTVATGETSTGYSDTGLSAETTYYYVVTAVNAGGESGNSNEASATTESSGGGTATTMFVSDIAPSTFNAGAGNKQGQAAITILDDTGGAVSGATVTGTFSGSYNETVSATTNSSGVATLTTAATVKGKVSFQICVDNVSGTLTYDPSQNIESCDDL